MTKVFVSGCYDILHGGHIQFFRDARALGDHLTVCFASDEVYRAWKGREPALPEDSRRAILEELRCVDEVVMSTMPAHGVNLYMDFARYMFAITSAYHPILAVTDDDANIEAKRKWCEGTNKRFVVLPKTVPGTPISTTAIRERAGL